jgi:hypothetical protein
MADHDRGRAACLRPTERACCIVRRAHMGSHRSAATTHWRSLTVLVSLLVPCDRNGGALVLVGTVERALIEMVAPSDSSEPPRTRSASRCGKTVPRVLGDARARHRERDRPCGRCGTGISYTATRSRRYERREATKRTDTDNPSCNVGRATRRSVKY